MYAYIQLSFIIFFNKNFFLVQHMFNFLVETFSFFSNDVFEKSNKQIFSCGNCTINKKDIQPKCLIFSHNVVVFMDLREGLML